MDSFNPFANAWGDDTAASSGSPEAGPSTPAKASSFTFAREDAPSTAATHNDQDDPLGFKSSFRPSAGVDDDEDAWGNSQPVASTSTLASRPDEDEWAPQQSISNSPKHASPQARAAEGPEDSWHQSTSSPALDASPPAWAIEDDELREGTSNQEDIQHSYTERSSEDRPEDQEEEGEGGFGGFAEALPDLGPVRTPPTRQDSDTDWGATDLPPSKWDEHVNAPPTWQGASPEVDEVELDAEGTNDPWRPPEAQRQSNSHNPHTNEEDALNRSLDARKTSEEAELDLERLQSELGIQIRNLDEEYAKQSTAKSPISSQKSPTIPPPSTGNRGPKWSIWGSKKSTTTTTGEGDNESSSRRGSIDAKVSSSAISPSAISPRSSISTAGIGSQSSSPTPDITQDSTPSNSAAGTSQEQQQQQQAGVSRFFRFGKGRATSADPTSTKNDNSMSSISTSIKSTPASAAGEVEKQKKVEITDDFSQLENFDSKRSTSANGMHSNSGYDDDNFGNDSKQNHGSNREDDGFSRKGWFWNRNRVVDYSNEQYEEEQDLDKVFSAFSNAPPPPPTSTSRTTTLNRVPSLRSQGRSLSNSSNNMRGIIPGSKQDPFAHLSAAASSIRSSASIDPFDPLDPLAELNQVSNITSRHYKDHPSPRIHTAVSSPILPPPPTSSAGMGLARPSSSISRPGSTTFQSKTTSTPPPLLAPPAPLSSISSRKVPQTTSLLDDLADLNFTTTSTNLHTTSTSSPASGSGPIIAQAPIAIKPPLTNQPSTNILEDDFGDFENFSSPNMSASVALQSNNSNIPSPKKASGPMKLNSKQTALPKSDADFFDLL